MPESTRVVVATPYRLVCDALRDALQDERFEVIGAAASPEAVHAVGQGHPEVLICDDHLRSLSVLVRSVRKLSAKCRVVILLSEDDPTEVLSLFDAGASGFLLKTGSLGELVEAIHVVIRGDVWISPKMLKHVLESLIDENRETFEAARRISSLTRREREVLARLSAGEDIEAIARDLMISLGTARTHIQNMLVKLGVHSRLEASAVTRRWGIDREFMVASDEAADSSRRRDGR